MKPSIALQMYSVRHIIGPELDYATVLRKVGAMGYDGIETAGFPGTTPAAVLSLCKELGMVVCSAHVSSPVGEKKNEILETLAALECKTLINTQIGGDDVKSLDTIKKCCDRLNEGYVNAHAAGLNYGIHNHWWEYGKLGDRYIYHIMREMLDPGIFFQLDTYWIKTGGVDPAAVVKETGTRCPYLHIKDGPALTGVPMVAVGDGVMDFPAILAAGGSNLQWLIVELDECASPILPVVEKSCKYLKSIVK